MNESEKERLIKKDIESIENRVSHAFNQGYEMGLKESRSKNPNTCGDAISRQEVLEIINFEEKWLLDVKSHNEDTKIAFSAIKSKISDLTSVNPQQRTGQWMKEGQGGRYKWMCSNCESHHRFLYDYCPSCGAKMQEEDQ